MSDENKEKKDIKVVEGTGNLDISPVYDHLSGSKPKMQDEKPKNIVIPQVKKNVEKKKKMDDNTNTDADLTDDIDDKEEKK